MKDFIGKRIKQLRKSNGLSLREMAVKVGVSDTALSKIETGKTHSLTIDLGEKISSALGVSFIELFEVEEPEISSNSRSEDIEQLKNRIIELEDRIKDKTKVIESNEGTVMYWNLFQKYSRIITAENNEISAIELENRVMAEIYKNDGPFFVKIDKEKNWSFFFEDKKSVD